MQSMGDARLQNWNKTDVWVIPYSRVSYV
jgi:hypothetical protein